MLVAGALGGGAYYYNFFVYGHFHVVLDGEVYRSAQPTPAMLDAWVPAHDLRTVINLRGKSSGAFYHEERASAERLGIAMHDVKWSAVREPPQPALHRLIELLETAPRPLLIHCKRGVDRTGVASVMAQMAIGGRTYEEARPQLSLRYWRFPDRDDDIAGVLYEYEKQRRASGLELGGWPEFRRWALEDYRPGFYFVEISAPEEVTAIASAPVDVELRITNRSTKTLPAGDPDRRFYVATFTGTSIEELPDEILGTTTLERRDLAPGESLVLRHRFELPTKGEAGAKSFEARHDIVESKVTWFARQGSPMGSTMVTLNRGAPASP